MAGRLIFDGDCGFCTTAASWIERRWPSGVAVITPWQFLSDEELGACGLTRDLVARKVYWHDETGNFAAERAIARALQAARGPWKVLGRAIDTVPLRTLARPTYWLVARFRHRLPGGTPACRMP